VKNEGWDREYLLATYFDYVHHCERATLVIWGKCLPSHWLITSFIMHSYGISSPETSKRGTVLSNGRGKLFQLAAWEGLAVFVCVISTHRKRTRCEMTNTRYMYLIGIKNNGILVSYSTLQF
jgi:hypothetical protein